jgi:hypothetical protein
MQLVELQREGWDRHKIDRDVGCQVLDEIEMRFPGDTALVELRTNFVETAQETYIRTIEDRKPDRLERKTAMTRERIIEFFDVCNPKVATRTFQEYMLKYMQDNKQVPNKLIAEMQKDYLEYLGYEREHGCKELSKIPQQTAFKGDQEMMYRFADWQKRATQVCMGVVRTYQEAGGQMPDAVMPENPVLKEYSAKAKEEVEKMTPEERGILLTTMTKKFEVLQNLPNDARQEYMKKLADSEKLELAKAQLLLMSVMRQQWESQKGQGKGKQQPSQCPHHGAASGGYDGGDSKGAPEQQQMM